MKKIYTIGILLLTSTFQIASAQVTDGESRLRTPTADSLQGWKKGGIISINLAQTSLKNWAAGGQNSFALNSLLSVFANYKKEKTAWDNTLDVGYGILKQSKGSESIKTDDKIDFVSKYGRAAFKDFYYAALLNFKTQMTPGYNYPNTSVKISNLLAPAYLLGSLGMDYKPNNYFSAFLAPLTGKFTIVNDQTLANAGSFGVEPAVLDDLGNVLREGKKLRSEFGGYIRIIYSRNNFKNELLKNVAFTTKLDMFSNYLNNPQNIDVSWENLIVFPINKYVLVNLSTHLLYDDDTKISIDNNNDGIVDETGPRTQFKEILGVGFSYKFLNK